MEYAAWKLFIDAAELGSLSKVAAAYGTSQPYISRQISILAQDGPSAWLYARPPLFLSILFRTLAR